MNRSFSTLSLSALLLLTPALSAQALPPHVGYVYPAGGQQGTTFEVKLGGQHLDEATAVQVSGAGVTAKVLRQTKPLKPQEINELRTKLKDLNEKTPKTADDEKEIQSIRDQMAKAEIPVSPALGENVFAEVTVEKTAPPGPRELRLRSKTGLSNPMVFDVGQLPEVRQTKESFDPEARLAGSEKPHTAAPASEVKIVLPAVLNSQLLPGEVDRYRFHAAKDQQLVFRTRARALIPYLADAVPRMGSHRADPLRRGRQRAGLQRRLREHARPGDCVQGSRRRRVRAGDPRCDLPRPGGLRLPHRGGRAAPHHRRLPAGGAGRRPDHGRPGRLEPAAKEPDPRREGDEAGQDAAVGSERRTAVEFGPVPGERFAGLLRNRSRTTRSKRRRRSPCRP